VFHDRSKHIRSDILYQGYGTEGSSEAPVRDYRGSGCGRVHQAVVEDEVRVLQGQAWCGPSSEGVTGGTHPT
jgi:hypothetical protein